MNPEAMTRLTYIIDAGSQFTKVAYLDKLSPPKASLRRSGHSEQFGNTRLVKSWPGGEKSSCPELLPTVIGYPRNDIPVWGYLALETTENVVLFPDRLCTERCEWKDDQFTNELYSLWGKQYHNLSSSRKPFNPFVDFLLAVMGFIHTIPSNRNIICSFIILVQPEWSLHMKTALYHKLIDHENIRLLDRTYSVRIFQGPDAGKIAFASNELQELSQPLVLLCDIGSFLVRLSIRAKLPTGDERILHCPPGLCGGLYLDQMFARFVEAKHSSFFNSSMPPPEHIQRRSIAFAAGGFRDTVKHSFINEPGVQYKIKLSSIVPDNLSEGIENGHLHMNRKDVLSLYTPVVEAISDYLRSSIKIAKDMIKCYIPELAECQFSSIIFMGGFSNSPVVQKSLDELNFLKDIVRYFPSRSTDFDGSTILCRSAAQPNISVKSLRWMKQHFIVPISMGFAAEVEWSSQFPLEHRIWNPYIFKYVAKDNMKWFAHQSDTIKPYISISLTKHISVTSSLFFQDTIYWYGGNSQSLPEFKDNGCKEFATAISELPENFRSRLRLHSRPLMYGGDFFEMKYVLHITLVPQLNIEVEFQFQEQGHDYEAYGDNQTLYTCNTTIEMR